MVAADYKGEPLVSFSEQEGKELGLKLGDKGHRECAGPQHHRHHRQFPQAGLASLSINFVMVFSPNTFAGAPHGWIATLMEPQRQGGG